MRNKCGHVAKYSGATFCSEDCAMENHDQEHDGDPVNWCEECSICMERVEQIKAEKAVEHGKDSALVIDKAIDVDIQHAEETAREGQ